MGGAGGRWDEEKPVENKPVESGGTIQPIRPLGVEIFETLEKILGTGVSFPFPHFPFFSASTFPLLLPHNSFF